MATTITTTNYLVIDKAESISAWSNETYSLEPDIKVEGGNSVACSQTQRGLNDIWVSGSFNLLNKHVRLYWNTAFVAYFELTNPVYVSLGDGTNNDYALYFAQSSEYGGGWVDLTVAASAANFPTVNLSAIQEVGVRVVTAAKPRNVPANAWFDNWRAVDGLTVGTTGGTQANFQSVHDLDALDVNGVINKVDGVFFLAGEILLSGTCDFNSVNETVVFPERNVLSTLYKLSGGGASVDASIQGMVLKAVNTNAIVDFSTVLSSLSIVSCSFIDLGTITFTPTVGAPVFDSNAFSGCGATTLSLDADTCAWTESDSITTTANLISCSVTNHIATGVFCSSLNQLDSCTFTSPGTGHAVDLGTISASVSMTWNSEAIGYAATDGSTGNETVRVTVEAGQTLTINNEGSGLSIKNDGPGNVVIISGAVTIRITAIANDTSSPLEGARAYLKRVSDDTVILTGLTDANGIIEDTAYQYVGDEAVEGWVRKSTGPGSLYKTGLIGGTITSSGYNTSSILIRDDL